MAVHSRDIRSRKATACTCCSCASHRPVVAVAVAGAEAARTAALVAAAVARTAALLAAAAILVEIRAP